MYILPFSFVDYSYSDECGLKSFVNRIENPFQLECCLDVALDEADAEAENPFFTINR